jgi:hypothetical protein
MKIKRFTKKLMLNKKTIAHLNNGEMNHALGGASKVICTHGGACTKKCETFPILECTTGCPQPTG